MDTLNIHREYAHPHRTCNAWWSCKRRVDGLWMVHFHADYVPSTDWSTTEPQLMSSIHDETVFWKLSVDERMKAWD